MAEDGIESTRGRHGEPLELADDRRPGCTGRSCGRSRRPGRRRGTALQAVVAGGVEEPVGAPLARCWRGRRRRWRGSRARSRPGRRGSCRWTRPGRPAVTTGLSIGGGQLAAGDGRGVLDGVAHGAVHLRGAAQRVGVLHPGERRLAVAADRSASRPARRAGWRPRRPGPGCGRSACRSAANTASVPSSPSTLIAAARSAVVSSGAQVGDARARACRACRRCR